MEAKNNQKENIKEAIAGAIVFFDLFDHPLTGAEAWKYAYAKDPSLSDVFLADAMDALDGMIAGKQLETENGFYFLPGREFLAASSMRSMDLADDKFKTAVRAAGWLRFVPGVRLVAVCNSLAIGNVREQSDIDFFIITARNRIWLTRLFVTGVIQLLGIRRNRKKINDRVCLSFYVSEDNMDLEPISLERDPYLVYWIATLVPVYDNGYFSRFVEANSWIKKHLPDHSPVAPHRSRVVKNDFMAVLARISDRLWFDSSIGYYLEKLARAMQLKKMSKNSGSLAKENDTRVIISDTMLKFHETDRRGEYRDKWIKKTNEILG